jgi:sugar O-acyltransferase (sialic acid O-acetyltransferase NeuD family)
LNKKLALIGGGGHGKVCASIAEELGYEVCFFDDAFPRVITCGKWNVLGTGDDLLLQGADFDCTFVAVGNCSIREKVQSRLAASGFNIISLISSTASIHKSVKIGDGVLVVGNACINIDSIIEDGVIINTNASVDHDCFISSFAHISPGVSLAGEVTVGHASWIGIGSAVIQQITIGSNVKVGAGSTIIKSIPSAVTVVGSPGRIVTPNRTPQLR